ncbi:MAG: nucleotide exchange factor GrpE [Candidatus Micrarchaeia archaeon]|jgi:molecular chaperone GrpE
MSAKPADDAHNAPAEAAAPEAPAKAEGGNAKTELEERLLRVYAEFDNFRKRVQSEREEERERAEEKLVSDLLVVLDELDAALVSESDATQMRAGLQLVRGNFWKILSQRGLSQIECVGKKFDSSMHDAAKSVPAKSADEDGVVVEELRKGYEFNGKILRHPIVVVAQK